MAQEKSKILAIEDNPGDLRLLREILSQHANGQFDLTHAPTLEAALKILSREKFEVILLDLLLPDIFGLDTLKRVREAESETPVIVLTGFYDAEMASRAMEMGARRYFVKRFADGSALVREIRTFLKGK